MPPRSIWPVACLALTMLAAGCADSDGGATTSPAPSTTVLITSTTTTTAATTATAEPTTLSPDLHPVIGWSWNAAWPGEGAEATYHVVWETGVEQDMTARVMYGVPWQGGTWDCLVVGTPELGGAGIAWYFARPEPWRLRLGGADAYWVNQSGAQMERGAHTTPVVLDMSVFPSGTAELTGVIAITSESNDAPLLELPFTARVTAVAEETVTVPAGTFTGTWRIRVSANVGDSYLWLDPGQLLVRWDHAGLFDRIEMVTPWH